MDALKLVRKFHEKHGLDWRKLADELGKHRSHVKDTWRRIKLPNLKKGSWSQDEYQNLFDLVNIDLQIRASEKKHSKHGMLRDNISWGAISDKLSPCSITLCFMKCLDACCIDDADWDNLIDHRSGDTCRKRWNQMVWHIGHHACKSFAEQVEILSQRYCPNLLEGREIWENKLLVP